MTKTLTRSDLIGQRIRELRRRVAPIARLEMFDGLDCLHGIFVLENGLAFESPAGPDAGVA